MSDLTPYAWIEPLHPRESEILRLLSAGLSNQEIARKLHLSTETVKWYNKQIYSKLGVSSRTQAVAVAQKHQMLDSPQAQPAPAELHNLPARLTSFVGRAQEVQEIHALLKTNRLVVLTGPGGTGKTRLALEAAAGLVDAYRDGVWLIELAPLREAELVPKAIAQALHVGTSGTAPVLDMLKHHLRSRRLLLLLDNFEHLLDAALQVNALLAAAPQVSVLATSRERLHLSGEQEYPVRPLALPDARDQDDIDRLMANDSVRLFVQRARAIQPGFSLPPAQAAALVQLCNRLDGLPLAIELAASQVKTHPPTLLVQRLSDMLAALPGGARDLPARQRTLSAAIRWSYDLLSPPEQSLFAALSVFRRGATWDAIQSVCTPSPHAPLIDRLSSLVEKNLVLVGETPQGELRFSMLETIRAFAAGCLQASAAAEITHQRHAAYFTELVEHASEEIRDRRQAYWYPRLQQEQDNLRAVLEWSLSGPEIEYGVRTATGLRDFWFYNGFLAESRRWFNLALQVTTGDRTALRAGILMASGGNAFVEYDAARGNAELLQAIQLYEQLGDERMLAWARIKLSIYSIEAPEQYDAGIALCRQGLEVFMRLGDLPGIAQAYNILGELARLVGDYAAAETYYLTCRDVSEETGELMRVAMSDTNLGFIAYHKGRYRQSAELIQRGLRAIHSMQNDYGITTMMGSLAGPLAQISEVDRAARLLGASFALLEASSARFQPSDMPEINLFMHTTREIMGAERFDQAYQAGRSLSQAEALTLALSPLPA